MSHVTVENALFETLNETLSIMSQRIDLANEKIAQLEHKVEWYKEKMYDLENMIGSRRSAMMKEGWDEMTKIGGTD